MRFVFVSFLFLVDDFDLSVSSATRNRADQPIRPSVCARQCPGRGNCAARGRLRVLDFGRTTFGAVRRGPTRRSAIAIPIAACEPKQSALGAIAPDAVKPTSESALTSAIQSGNVLADFETRIWRDLALRNRLKVCPRNTLKTRKGKKGTLNFRLFRVFSGPQKFGAARNYDSSVQRFRCGAAAPAIAKAAGRATGRQES